VGVGGTGHIAGGSGGIGSGIIYWAILGIEGIPT
jgi:hypothetical protein